LIVVSLLLLGWIDPLEAVEINLYTGTATHRIPIEVPPGPGGLVPSLALVYNGTETNSWLGMGWRIQGVSHIETVGPEARGETTLTTNYRLVLPDGSTHRLVYASPPPPDDFTTNYIYRTERESFLSIVQIISPTRWIITDRSGVKYEYGGEYLNDFSSQSILGRRGRMYLTEIRDTHGNTIRYTYTRFPSTAYTTSDLYPDQITWGPGGNMSVKFIWKVGRPDTPRVHVQGPMNVNIDQQLDSIEVRLGGQLIRRYVLGYTSSPATGLGHATVSHLTSMQIRGADDKDATALPLTRFTYHAPTGMPSTTQAEMPGGGVIDRCKRLVDVNGDGWTDVVSTFWSSAGDSIESQWMVGLRNPDGTSFKFPAQINSNGGLPDTWWPYLCSNRTYDIKQRVYWLNSYLLTFKPTQYDNKGHWLRATVTVPVHYTEIVDIDGDGLPDILHQPGDSVNPAPGRWTWRKNMGMGVNGTGLSVPIFGAAQALINPPPLGWMDDARIQLADMNGDGLLDIVWWYASQHSNPNLRWWHINWWANVGNGRFQNPFGTSPICGLPAPNAAPPTGCSDVQKVEVPATVNVEWRFMGVKVNPFHLIDMNGDGTLDFTYVYRADGITPTWTYFPTSMDVFGSAAGTRISLGNPVTLTNPSPAPTYDPFGSKIAAIPLDVNQDGFIDILVSQDGREAEYYPGLGGTQLGAPITLTGSPQKEISLTNNMTLNDLNGDGRVDIVQGENGAPYYYWGLSSADHRLLETVQTSYGGTHTLSYERQRIDVPAFANGHRWVVSQITRNDGLGQAAPTNYAYSGGRSAGWPWNEFRGFATVTVTEPPDHEGNRHRVVMNFHQDDARKGFKSQIDAFKNTTLFTRKFFNYAVSTLVAGVTRVDLTGEVDQTFDGVVSAPKFKSTGYGNFDAYGQAREVTVMGTDIATRLSTTTFLYSDFTSNPGLVEIPHFYIVDRPSKITTKVDGKLATSTSYAYDGKAVNALPSKGDLTREARFDSTGTPSEIVTTHTYDIFGNRIGTLDPNGFLIASRRCATTGFTTKIDYDPTYQTFPVAETNALCQQITKTYWGVNTPSGMSPTAVVSDGVAVPGLLATVTDLNGVRTDNYYDAIGRLRATIVPPDTTTYPTTLTNYTLTGTAPSKTHEVKREQQNTASVFETFTYTDGFGRAIQTKNEAEMAGQWITIDTQYNARGLTESVSVTYITAMSARTAPDTAKPKTTTLYDAVRRPIKVTNPDNTFRTLAYDRWTVIETDEKGYATTRTSDALGRLIRVVEPAGGGTTTYSYDTFESFDPSGINPGKMQHVITDAQGNVTRTIFTSSGRKKQAIDPDLGTWSYTYDHAGNVITQTDANGNVIRFAYDNLNRVISKVYPGGAEIISRYDDATANTYRKGRVWQVEDPSGMTTFTYDTRGQTVRIDKLLCQINCRDWRIDPVETVRTSISSLALDSSGNSHIAYHDRTTGTIKYAKWTGNSWAIQTVDTPAAGGNYGVPSIALDSAGNPHIAYQGATPTFERSLRYAKWTGSSWAIQTVDNSTTSTGWFPSLAVDGAGNPHIAYHDATNELENLLKYAKWNGSAWTFQTIDLQSGPSIGIYHALALDSAGNPAVAYVNTSGLKYAKWNGSSWVTGTTVDASPGHYFSGLSLAIDASGSAHVSYIRAEATGARLWYGTGAGVTWTTEAVDTSSDVSSPSIALNSTGQPSIAYQDRVFYSIKYARRTGSGWSIQIVDNTDRSSPPPSMKFDTQGNAHISYVRSNTTTNVSTLLHAKGVAAANAPSGTTYTTQYTYDSMNRLVDMTYPDNEVVRQSYNTQGLLEKIRSVTGGFDYVTNFNYNALGQVTERTLGSGLFTQFQYKPGNFRLHSIFTTAGNICHQSLAYSYDPVGNVTEISDYRDPITGACGSTAGPNTQRFGSVGNDGYDPLNRLRKADGPYSSQNYIYSPIGNMTDGAGSALSYPSSGFPRPHAPTAANGCAYAYDANGNMISRTCGNTTRTLTPGISTTV
jgi:YD repeat-containing protein